MQPVPLVLANVACVRGLTGDTSRDCGCVRRHMRRDSGSEMNFERLKKSCKGISRCRKHIVQNTEGMTKRAKHRSHEIVDDGKFDARVQVFTDCGRTCEHEVMELMDVPLCRGDDVMAGRSINSLRSGCIGLKGLREPLKDCGQTCKHELT